LDLFRDPLRIVVPLEASGMARWWDNLLVRQLCGVTMSHANFSDVRH
jgi:hypothetical protein